MSNHICGSTSNKATYTNNCVFKHLLNYSVLEDYEWGLKLATLLCVPNCGLILIRSVIRGSKSAKIIFLS